MVSDTKIRSYHRAFTGELMIYNFGKDLRPWKPIPARGIFWAGAIVAFVFVSTHIFGISVPLGSLGWMCLYAFAPVGIGWLFSAARIEGRRLHVVMTAWLTHVFHGRKLIGWDARAKVVKPASRSSVRVAVAYEPRTKRPIRRYAVAGVPLVLVGAVFAIVAKNGSSTARVALRPTTVATEVPAVVALPKTAPPKAAPVKVAPPPVVHVRLVRHVQRPRPHPARAPAPPPPVVHVAPAPAPAPAPVVSRPYRPAPTPVPIARATVAATPAPVRHSAPAPVYRPVPQPTYRPAPQPAPRPTTPSCYPGTLGC